jgi:hypothetical protein
VNINKLRKRLRKIGAVDKNGAAISERTLRDWAAKGLITGPEPAPRKTRKRRGRPLKSGTGNGEIERGEPGRFYKWHEKSYEEAAAVWSIRHVSHGVEKKFKFDNEAIIRQRFKVEEFYHHFNEGLAFFETWAHFELSDHEFGRNTNSLFVSWVAAVEKARKTERLDTPVKIVFRWLIKQARPTLHLEDRVPERKVLLTRLEAEDALDSVETYFCYSEEPVAGYRAYRPGTVIVEAATEAGLRSYRTYDYFPASEFIALTLKPEYKPESLCVFGHYPALGEQRRENGFLLERID